MEVGIAKCECGWQANVSKRIKTVICRSCGKKVMVK